MERKEIGKIEIAFFCYKASMADSLESIYLAVKSDQACDVYFIPIPYFDKNPDGSLGEMKLEAEGSYQGNIELTDWQEYDPVKRRPDIIFVMNPYDNTNAVTTVHPDYYVKRLKKYCNLLCYVPYFVSSEDVSYVDGDESLCANMGTLYADYVFVQSENVKKAYTEGIRQYEKDASAEGIFGDLDHKIIALGHPKFDKLRTSSKEQYTLPKEWEDKIKNKKIILYNISISSLLRGGQRYLNKVAAVIKSFEKYDDIILWWRPHPLLEQVMLSMKPRLHRLYRGIIEEYKKADYGIYDDTPDLYRAIMWSDAYYGDGSSVEQLYSATGKPIMIANANMLYSKIYGSSNVFYVSQSHVYIMIRKLNVLIRLEKSTQKFEFMGFFPDGDKIIREDSFLYLRPSEVDNHLYFPPFVAEGISVLDLDSFEFEKIEFGSGTTTKGKFFNTVFTWEDYIYFVPHTYNKILQIRRDTKEVEYLPYHTADLEDIKLSEAEDYFFAPTMVDRDIWMTKANVVLQFNVENKTVKSHVVGDKDYKYRGICYDGEHFWLSPQYDSKTPIVKWHPDKGILKEYWDIYNEEEKKYSYNALVYGGGWVWLLPFTSKKAYKINVNTDEIQIAEEFEKYISEDTGNNIKFESNIQVDSDNIYAYSQAMDILVAYNFITNKTVNLCEGFFDKVFERVLPHVVDDLRLDPSSNLANYLMEGPIISLERYAKIIARQDLLLKTDKKFRGLTDIKSTGGSEGIEDGSGEKIFTFVKNNIVLRRI